MLRSKGVQEGYTIIGYTVSSVQITVVEERTETIAEYNHRRYFKERKKQRKSYNSSFIICL